MNKGTTGLLFPGYGSQYVGMGKDFYDTYRSVQELFEQASDCTGINFVKLCFASSESVLALPLNAYLASFVVQSSIYAVLCERGIKPAMVGGWGVGTMSAHYAAGVLTLPDALYVLRKYTEFLMDVLKTHGCNVMRVNGVSRQQLEEYLAHPALKQSLALVAVFSEFCVVVGTGQGLKNLEKVLGASIAIEMIKAPFCYGLHLFQLDEFLKVTSSCLAKIDCQAFRITLIAQNGTCHKAGTQVSRSLFLEPLCGPIEVEGLAKHLRTCAKLIGVGYTYIPVQQYAAPAKFMPCKTVHDMMRI